MRFLVLAFILVKTYSLYAVTQINIWEGTSCKKEVKLRCFTAPGSNRPAIIVCPGGSYFWHNTKAEGDSAAKWLQENGISAFVLNYRTAQTPAFIYHHRLFFKGNRYPDAQDDLLQALRYIRLHSAELGVDATRLGAMGFSAGGHLVLSGAEYFPKHERPAFVVAAYPVITMMDPYVHKRSRRGLLGDSKTRNKALKDHLSLERHVPNDCPPVFLLHCEDDPVVDYHNSVMLDSALTAKKIDHIYIQYPTGGHGFGVSNKKKSKACMTWKEKCLEWIKEVIR